MVAGTLAADADVLALLARGADGHRQQLLDRRVALVEQVGDDPGVPVQAQGELGQVVGADREAVEDLQELLGQQRVGGDLAHHDDLQAVLALLEAVGAQHLDDLAALVQGAHERDHHPDVVQAHLATHAAHGPALQRERLGKAGVDVAAGAAEPDHRVLLVRLVAAAADQVGVFVGLEVRHAHDHRVRVHRSGDRGDALGQAADVELHRVGVAGDLALDLQLDLRVLPVVLQQRLGVHADVAGDDHLQPRQADAGVGQHGEVEGALRVGDVHHHLQRSRRHVLQVGGRALEGQGALVDEAGVAFRAADGDRLAVLDGVQRIAGADHRGHAQFAGDDRGVAGAPAAVGDDGGGALHHRLPVGIGHVGDQYISGLHALHVGQGADHAGHAAADLLADRAALADHRATLAQVEALDLGRLAARLHRLRAGLDDEQLAADPVLRPFDVHRPAVVLLDDQGLLGQLLHVLVGDGEPAAELRRGVLGAHALAGLVGVDHPQLLGADRAAQDRLLPRAQGGLVDVELVRVDRALDHHLAQAVAGGDEDHVAEAGLGVQGEQHARGAHVRAHHQLHAGGQEHVLVLEAVVHPIGDGAVVVEAGEDFLDLEDDVVLAGDVEEGLLLPGKGRVREILGGGRGAHGDRHVAAAVLRGELAVGLADLPVQFRLQRGFDHPAADLAAGTGQRIDVLDVQAGQAIEDALVQVVVGDEVLERLRGGREPARNRHAQPREVADHLAEGGVLAAHAGKIVQAQLVQPEDVLLQDGISGECQVPGRAAKPL